jgi:hypothetical protein
MANNGDDTSLNQNLIGGDGSTGDAEIVLDNELKGTAVNAASLIAMFKRQYHAITAVNT